MSIIISHPTGNECLRAAANGFLEKNMLGGLYTAVASFPGSVLYKAGSIKWLADIRRRSFDASLKDYTHTHPLRELGRMLAIKAKQQKLVEHEKGVFCVDKVYESVDKFVARRIQKEKKKRCYLRICV